MELNPVRGLRDTLPPESEETTALEETARSVFRSYGFREIRLPTLEFKELFVKTTGETTDIVEKEMYEFEDQGGRRLALRPEGTPGVVRAFIHNHLNQQGGAHKLFYMGSMFRAERPQAGRFREFEQIGVECLGNPHPAADVETILTLKALFDAIGLGGKTRLRLNNIGCENPTCRPNWRSNLQGYLKGHLKDLCDDCKKRIQKNPLRALDCKKDSPKLAGAPKLDPCSACSNHVSTVSMWLKQNGLPHLYPDMNLVRGLDYYTRTVFEFAASGIGSQDALAGGGRYDGLVAAMGGPDTPAVGWALGVERTLAAARAAGFKSLCAEGCQVFLAVQSELPEAAAAGVKALEDLRRAGIPAGGGLFASSLKAQMREANRQGARLVVLIGDQELAKSACVLKDMAESKQEEILLSALVETVEKKLKKPRGS